MITLTPIGIAQNMLSPLIADRVKEAISTLTSELTPEMIQTLVDKDISLWSCFPEGAREQIREATGSMSGWIKLVSDGDLAKWVRQSRPDLEDILSTSQGKQWLSGLLRELREHLGA